MPSPRKSLTPQSVERLNFDHRKAPPSGKMEIRDAVVPGLVLRVTANGVKSYCVRYTVPGEGGVSPTGRLRAGKDHRITLGNTPPLELKDAREQARKIIEVATEGRDPRVDRREKNLIRHSNTFDKVSARFIELEMKPSVKNWKSVQSTLKRYVEPEWCDMPVQDLSRRDVHELFDGLVEEDKVAIAIEVRKHLSRFFNWCVDRELVPTNPIYKLVRGDLKSNEEAGRALTDDELRRIWRAADGMRYPFGPLYQLLMLTGQRRNEWAAASRSEIDGTKRLLEVPKARYKGKRDHVVPLSEQAWSIFDDLPEWTGKNDYFIFSTRDGEVPVSGFSKAKRRLDEAAAVKLPYRVHDFRVTCETRLASLGFNQDTRDAVLGHAKAGLQKTYNKHQYLAEKRAALDAYAAHIMKVVA